MNNDSPFKAFIVVLLVALTCSSLVSAAVVLLRPIQMQNQVIERSRKIIHLTGLLEGTGTPSDEEMLSLYRNLDIRIVNLEDGSFEPSIDPATFDQRKAASDPELSEAIPAPADVARLGRRSRYATVYLVWKDGRFDRIILPINGTGMWSMLYGYIALKSDLNTIAAATFYEHGETPGLGDQITRPDWLAHWEGRKIRDQRGELRFEIGAEKVEPGSPAADYQVDALTGATVTSEAVAALVRFWMDDYGFGPMLDRLREQPPVRGPQGGGDS